VMFGVKQRDRVNLSVDYDAHYHCVRHSISS
jgi:hypothetical protein